MSLFSDTETAFKLKTNKDLKKAEFLFSCIEKPMLTKFGTCFLNTAVRWNLPLVKKTVKSTLFRQFCGGETMRECVSVIDNMHELGVSSILDYSVEGKADEATFEHTLEETIRIINFSSNNPAVPFVVFKPTGFGRMELYEKVESGTELTEVEKEEWERVKNRYYTVCDLSVKRNTTLMIDAEHSWIQGAVDTLTEELMVKYNKQRCIIFGTIQMYRVGRLEFLQEQYRKAKEGNYFIGFKIVRGAYMEIERDRAKEKGYPSPIQPDKESTDKQYNAALGFMIDHLDIITVFAGTHNEDSCLHLIKLMTEREMQHGNSKIWFGQLYGMSDNISFILGRRNYNIAKYLPYGPVADVVPYLTRRAEENTSVAGQTGRELALIKRELKRRKE